MDITAASPAPSALARLAFEVSVARSVHRFSGQDSDWQSFGGEPAGFDVPDLGVVAGKAALQPRVLSPDR